MILIGLAFLALALFDIWFTVKRIPQLGIEAELNPIIRSLSKRFGIKLGTYVGVLIPTVFVIALGFDFPSILLVIFGCRLTMGSFQYRVYSELKKRGLWR